ILIANRDANSSIAKLNKKRRWWTPPLFTASIAYAKYFFQHTLRQNTIIQARRNISQHYDLSNELFSLFLDDTMTYSCAIFKREDEDLRVAQLRKISLLIEKAKIDKNHHVLDIGCGWGSLAIELVKQTGCHCTAITLSKEQLKYAEQKVKVLGLQDNIKFHLCDYRQLSNTLKYDRIISCGMLECVGHEFMEDFFGSCESVLAENGLLVLQ
uniref:Cyclopropane-fatty-acyl-phospholipid synthase n=1 Tax=Cucumis melo TaxID=3656 RepID=A0A9I9E159_CUCME